MKNIYHSLEEIVVCFTRRDTVLIRHSYVDRVSMSRWAGLAWSDLRKNILCESVEQYIPWKGEKYNAPMPVLLVVVPLPWSLLASGSEAESTISQHKYTPNVVASLFLLEAVRLR